VYRRLKVLCALRDDLNVYLLSNFLLVKDIDAQLIFVFFNRKWFKDAVEKLFLIWEDIVSGINYTETFKSLINYLSIWIFATILDVAFIACLDASHILDLDGKFERMNETYWCSREVESIFGGNYKAFIRSQSSTIEIEQYGFSVHD
jgi:hypothetical protein